MRFFTVLCICFIAASVFAAACNNESKRTSYQSTYEPEPTAPPVKYDPYAAERAGLNNSLQEMNDTLQLCQNATYYRNQRIDSINSRIGSIRLQIETDSIDFKNYIAGCKKADIACIISGEVGAKVKLDFEHEYPDIVNDIAEAGLVFSLAHYILNKKRVDEVYDNIVEANSVKKELYANIETENYAIIQEMNVLSEIEIIRNRCVYNANAIKARLSALPQVSTY